MNINLDYLNEQELRLIADSIPVPDSDRRGFSVRTISEAYRELARQNKLTNEHGRKTSEFGTEVNLLQTNERVYRVHGLAGSFAD